MFQYAAGRALSLANDTSLKLDISNFKGYQLHQGFELERVFNCRAELANGADIQGVLGWQNSPMVRKVLLRNRMSRFRSKHFVLEPHFSYWGGLRNVPSDCYIMGYWQSEKYFLEAAVHIRSDFVFRCPMSAQNSELAEQIKQEKSVSLHVRRGDYVSSPQTNATHGVCSIDYYNMAIQYVKERLEGSCFFVFSDDIEWVKANLKIDSPCIYVDHNRGLESYNDMRLMALCQHHIIANSSFSWWGAWLSSHSEQIVVAPKRWFANDTNIQDLHAPDWVPL